LTLENGRSDLIAMASSPFLSLPREVRDLIYAKSVPYAALNHILRIRAQAGYYREPVRLRTPNILLLNRQITTEALSAWRRQPFTLTVPLPMRGGDKPNMSHIHDVLSQDTLQALTHVHLVIDFSVWKGMDLLGILNWTSAWEGTVVLLNRVWLERNKLEVMKVRVIGSVPADAPWARERLSMYNSLIFKLFRNWQELSETLPPHVDTDYTPPKDN
jgi:hypothetical protein